MRPSLTPTGLLCSVSTALHVADVGCDTSVEWRTIRPGAPCSLWLRASLPHEAMRGPGTVYIDCLHQRRLKSQYLLDRLRSVLMHAGSPAPQKCAVPFLVDDKVGKKKRQDRVDPAVLEVLN